MTADGEGLLRAVLERPDDDAPRLVYADWLEERQEEVRAAHIRLAIREGEAAAAAFRRAHGADRWVGTAARRRGVRPLPHGRLAIDPEPVFRYEWARGFLMRLWATHADFLADAPRLFAEHPLTEVLLLDRRPIALDGAWAWYVRDSPAGAADLPPRPQPNWAGGRLGPLLGGWGPVPGYPDLRAYPGEGAALAALSRACVAYGRRLAGLSDLAV